MENKYLKTVIVLNEKMKNHNSDSYFMSFNGDFKEVPFIRCVFYSELQDDLLETVNKAISQINLQEVDAIRFSLK